jgi:hypothetical protein
MSIRFGILRQNFPVSRVFRARVTVLIARPEVFDSSWGLIGPSLSSLSNTRNVLFVRLIDRLTFSTFSFLNEA